MVRRSTTEWLKGDDRFIEVMHALTNPDDQWTHPEQPDILSVLEELAAWANDSREYDRRFHESGWASVVMDFLAIVERLGAQTKQVVNHHIDVIKRVWKQGIGEDQAAKDLLSQELTAMRDTLADSATLTAAWRDLLKCCSRVETNTNTVAVRRDTFWSIVRASDRNTVELSRSLSAVLTGDAMAIHRVKVSLGQGTDLQDFLSLRNEPLADPRERLALAEILLNTESEAATHVVWLAYRHAILSEWPQQFGFIQFFDARWLRGNLFEDGPSKQLLPGELSDLKGRYSIPDQRDVVLVRIDLGVGTFSDAVRIGGERVDALIGLSSIDCHVPWERMPGFIHAKDGNIVSHHFFSYSDDKYRSPDAMHDTAVQISIMAPRVSSLVPIKDPDIKNILDALRWWRDSAGQPSAASIVLNVRAIELIASRIGIQSWTSYLQAYLKNEWIRVAILDSMYYPLYEALHRNVTPDAQEDQRAIFLKATGYEQRRQTFNIHEAIRHIDDIIRFTPPNHPLSRDLQSIKRRTANNAGIRAWCTELERAWNGTLARMERVRNAIAHGGPFTDQAVQLIHPFSQRLSAWALTVSMEGFLKNRPVTESQKEIRRRGDLWRSSMSHAASVDEIFVDTNP